MQRTAIRAGLLVGVDLAARDTDVAAMRTIKSAFDPAGYLNAAVVFSPGE